MNSQFLAFPYVTIFLIIICLLCDTLKSFAQIQPYKAINIGSIKNITVDSRGNFHTVKNNSEVSAYKYDGTLIQSFTPEHGGLVTYMDVSNTFNIFYFFKDLQTCLYTDRYYAPITTIKFHNLGFDDILYAAPANDNNLWVLEGSTNEISKVSVIQQQVIFTMSFKNLLQNNELIEGMQAHENKLFVLTNQQVYLFDLLGNFLYKIKKIEKSIPFLSGNYLWLGKNNELFRIDIYTQNICEIKLPTEINVSSLALIENRDTLLIFNKQKLLFIRLNALLGICP